MIWLSNSLFCSQTEWHKLFADGIVSFLAGSVTNDFLEDYIIELNHLDGDNIRLSLLTTEINSHQLAKYTEEYFKDYFSRSNLFVPEKNKPVEGLFDSSFPSNTIQFDHYPRQPMTEMEKGNYDLSISLSQIMLEVFKVDIIDERTILTFAFYLQVSLIKCLNDIYPESVDLLKSVYTNLVYDTKIIDKADIQMKFRENKDILSEIKEDLMGDQNSKEMPKWIIAWIHNCKAEIKKYQNVQPEDIKTIYRKITYLTIHKHLAVTPRMTLTLSYFIDRIIFNL